MNAAEVPSGRAPVFDDASLRALITPLIIEQFLGVALGVADTVMIASVGETAMSGVSLVGMITNLINNLFGALATGGAVVVAQFIGARKRRDAEKSVNQLFFVALIASAVMLAIVLAGGRGLLSLCFGDIEPPVMDAAADYMRVIAFSFPFIALYNCAAATFRAVGNSRVSMSASAVVNVFNIGANALFIYGFKWGASGAALATALSWAIAMLYLAARLCMKKRDYGASDEIENIKETFTVNLLERFRPNASLIKKILYIGIPSGVENSVFQLGRLVVVGIIAKFGTTQISANAVANSLDSFGCIIGGAVGLAMITVVGRCVGMNDYAEAKRLIKKLMKLAYVCTAALNTCILLTLPLSIRLFQLSPETQRLAVLLIVLHNGVAMLLWPSSFVLPNAMRAAGDVKFTMTASVASMFICRVALSVALGTVLKLGAVGVWIAMICDWAVRSAVFFFRYRSGKWRKKSLAD